MELGPRGGRPALRDHPQLATKLAEAGAPEDARKDLMGHVSIGTTAGYTHWSPQTFAALVGKASHVIEQPAQVSAIG